jgi:hypothetical protein
MNIGKMYFARFTDKKTKEVFYKFGHTGSWDALDRFKHSPEQYESWDIKIMKTIAGPLEEMKGVEEAFKAFYPKNFWLEEKISGVTEIVKLEQPQVNEIITRMEFLGTKYYQKRERDRAHAQQEYNLNG